ncbi:DNA-binding protein [Citricoccus sp. SGAir0253]|uniref:zinc ribbon domain-containing protein n=1 Tax=Citricoccus sp. SGAir0253 TaxID=2567881 RepID=UPI0010CD2BD1|nr:DNA-binding protein [Citricoccus sp. SGAir0253]QCU78316.1 DNA-binding protein [Citricoccus sp. SGAir0253]
MTPATGPTPTGPAAGGDAAAVPPATTADPADQRRLLDLQALDTALDQARSRMQQLRQDPRYRELQQAVADRQAEADAAAVALEQARAAVTAADAEVAGVRSHRERNQRRLDAGEGSARDLERMMHELATLAELQDRHEEAELEAMDAAEQAEAADATAREGLAAAQRSARERAAELKAEADEVSARGQDLTARRAALAATLPPGLLARYERVRARAGGIGAARLVGNHSEASGMPISPADLEAIRRAPADTLVYCPDSGAILVRGDDA